MISTTAFRRSSIYRLEVRDASPLERQWLQQEAAGILATVEDVSGPTDIGDADMSFRASDDETARAVIPAVSQTLGTARLRLTTGFGVHTRQVYPSAP